MQKDRERQRELSTETRWEKIAGEIDRDGAEKIGIVD